MTDDEQEIALDLQLYGSAFWRMVDGKRVHVPMSDVRYPPAAPLEKAFSEASPIVDDALLKIGSQSQREVKP